MTRLNLFLLALLLGSAVYLVQTSYEARRLFVELEHERSVATRLGLEAERLQVERRARATHLRVEQVARERLQMRNSSPGVTEYLTDAAPRPAGGRP